MAEAMIRVEVALALPERQALIPLEVPTGTRVGEAIERSGVLAAFAGIVPEPPVVGIWGKVTAPDTVLSAGDRVEIYRPLTVDPKEARRRRVAVKAARARR
jgi:putative ubiquitin-RnfH superfamily antitoxin RatB of RatAB toxin-antitoxin module